MASKIAKQLRVVLKHTRHVENASDHILQRFRGEASTHPVHRQFARDFLAYVEELKVQDRLIQDYTGEKVSQEKRIENTASLVGLGLPELSGVGGGGGGAGEGGDASKPPATPRQPPTNS